MNLNEFAKEVHQNAVDHGWWGEEYTDAAVIALIHAEISEAMEEWRANRPMVYHQCLMSGEPCEGVDNCVHRCGIVEDVVTRMNPKPEGIAVELIDVVLRILDAAAAWNIDLRDTYCTPPDPDSTADTLKRISKGFIERFTLPELVCELHRLAVELRRQRELEENYDGIADTMSFMVGMVYTWLRAQNLDPEALLQEKHSYNKTRPYRHGGKRV